MTSQVRGSRSALATLLICIAAVGFGSIPYFAKSLTESGMTAPAVAFYRYAFTAIALSPFLLLGRETRSITAWGVFAGAAVGTGWIGYIRALEAVPVSTASVIYMTYPVFTLAIGWVAFRVAPARRASLAAAVILAAAVVGVSPAGVSTERLPALALALLSPLGFGIAINVLTNRLYRVPPLSRMASVAVGSTLGILPLIALSEPAEVVPASASQWGLIVGIAVVTALIPQWLYTTNAPKVGAARTAMAGSVELPTMFAIGWLAFGEDLGLLEVLAGTAILGAIAITPVRRHDAGAARGGGTAEPAARPDADSVAETSPASPPDRPATTTS